jgi:hypothetical protein
VVAGLDKRSHPVSDHFEGAGLLALSIEVFSLLEELGSEALPNEVEESSIA